MATLQEHLLEILIPDSAATDQDKNYSGVTEYVMHNSTGELFLKYPLRKGIAELYSECSRRSKLGFYEDYACFEARRAQDILEFIEVVEYIADNFKSEVLYCLPRITSAYREIHKPEMAIQRYSYYISKYASKPPLGVAVFTSISAAYKDMALQNPVGSPEYIKYVRACTYFEKLAEKEVNSDKSVAYLDKLVESIRNRLVI